MCLLRYPGYALAGDTILPDPVIHWIAKQVRSNTGAWPAYGEREKKRNEHLHELRIYLGLSVFGLPDFRKLVHSLSDLAMQTDKAIILAAHSLEMLRQKRIILPALTVIERACAEAVTRANRRIYRTLIEPLEQHHRRSLDNLLNVAPGMNITWLVWLRQSPLKPNSRHMREHIERLKVFRSLALPDGLGRQIQHAGLNKGEARNALARAVFIHRLGEIRDRTFEQQRYRASGLNLVTAAIVLWNTVYLERATQALRESGKLPDAGMLQFLSQLGWEHINLTGDYVWRQNRKVDEGKYRPLRDVKNH
jgi:TnpA family transposase